MASGGVHCDRPSAPKGGGSRVSVACIPCRSRHIRCDATKPVCNRCSESNKECHYTKSRRGGLDRAALAARRERIAKEAQPAASPSRSSPSDGDEANGGYKGLAQTTPFLLNDLNLLGGVGQDTGLSQTPDGGKAQALAAGDDTFIDFYYKCFHTYHPCILPRRQFGTYINDSCKRIRVEPVLSAVRHIGSLYARSDQSRDFAQQTANLIAHAQAASTQNPFVVQAQLLYSIAVYWSGDKVMGQQYLDNAIRNAVDMGMHTADFARENSNGDAMLEESWKRTWWQMFVVDASYAAIRRDTEFLTRDILVTTHLPCEESEYESGIIPISATLEDYDTREFSSDDQVFSSFAYLIGVVRSISQTLAATPLADKTCPPVQIVEAVDAVVDGWLLLLPESKRSVISKEGEIDELMFFAHMSIHASMVGLHRPFSALLYDPLETISSCAVYPPKNEPADAQRNIHTTRCFGSIEGQVRLLTLPKRPFCHSPFTICMIVTGAIPFLSGCKFVLSGAKLAIAREQIRLIIGCLKSLSGVWAQGAKNVQEIQTIAREVLGLGCKLSTPIAPSSMSASDTGSSQRSPKSQDGSQNSSIDDLLFPDTIDGLQSCWDMDNQDLDMSMWFASY